MFKRLIESIIKPKPKNPTLRELYGYYLSNPRYKNGGWGSLVWNENEFISNVTRKGKVYISEGIDYEFKYAGGIITFSTDVNAVIRDSYETKTGDIKTNIDYQQKLDDYMSKKDDINAEDFDWEDIPPKEKRTLKQLFKGFSVEFQIFIKSKFETLLNNIFKNKKITNVFSKFKKIGGFSIGNFFKGRFLDRGYGQETKIYDETSLSIEIVGIPFILLQVVASELCREFKQKSVLVKDNGSDKVLLVNSDPAEYSLKPKEDIKKDIEYYYDYQFDTDNIYDYIYNFIYSKIGSGRHSDAVTKSAYNELLKYLYGLHLKIKNIPLEVIDSVKINKDILKFKEELEYTGDMETLKRDLDQLMNLDFYDIYEIHIKK